MYYVQLVDDDPAELRKLSSLLDWKALGFEVSCLAYNGREALLQLEIEKIDLVITEIEIPLMDGLTLTRIIREEEGMRKPSREIIILTAYEDFEYAKTALRYRVSDYLLKSAEVDELAEAMRAAKKRLDENNSRLVSKKIH